jgi:hypothetical protein
MAFAPFTMLELVARTARHAERRIGGEFGEEAVEVLGAERRVGVKLDDEVGQVAEPLEPFLERTRDRSSAHDAGSCIEDERLDPVVLSRELGRELDCVVGRARVDDQPRLRALQLLAQRLRKTRKVGRLVANRRHDCV